VGKHRVYLRLEQLKTDPSQYKIFDAALGSDPDRPVFVGVEVDESNVIRADSVERGPQGLGTVKVLQSCVKIESEEGKIYEIAHDKVAEGVVVANGSDISFSLSTNGDWLYNLRPANGSFFAKFVGFTKKKDDPIPVPKLAKGGPRTSRDGKSYFVPDRWQFTAIHEIINGNFAGAQYVQSLDYAFREADNGNTILVVSGGRTQRVEKFLDVVSGGSNYDIPYSDNILPDLEAILLKKGAVYQIIVEKGWVNGINLLPEGITKEMLTAAKKPAAKSTTKKATSKKKDS